MKVIFLDFDGVMNNREWCRRDDYMSTGGNRPIDPAKAVILNEIVAKTGAKVVVSSTWRLDGIAACRKHLRRAGCDVEVVGVTGQHPFGRGEEIRQWIESHQLDALHENDLVTHYVILDDDTFDMGDQMPKLVATDFEIGLTSEHVPAILKHLEG